MTFLTLLNYIDFLCTQNTNSISPHNYLDQFHRRLIQGVKEFQEDPSLFTHLPDDKSKRHTEHDEAQHVDPIGIRADDCIFFGDVLSAEERHTPLYNDTFRIVIWYIANIALSKHLLQK